VKSGEKNDEKWWQVKVMTSHSKHAAMTTFHVPPRHYVPYQVRESRAETPPMALTLSFTDVVNAFPRHSGLNSLNRLSGLKGFNGFNGF
jgi:hypothetical protein